MKSASFAITTNDGSDWVEFETEEGFRPLLSIRDSDIEELAQIFLTPDQVRELAERMLAMLEPSK